MMQVSEKIAAAIIWIGAVTQAVGVLTCVYFLAHLLTRNRGGLNDVAKVVLFFVAICLEVLIMGVYDGRMSPWCGAYPSL